MASFIYPQGLSIEETVADDKPRTRVISPRHGMGARPIRRKMTGGSRPQSKTRTNVPGINSQTRSRCGFSWGIGIESIETTQNYVVLVRD